MSTALQDALALALLPLAALALLACGAPSLDDAASSSATGAGGGTMTGGSGGTSTGGSGGTAGATSASPGCDEPYDSRNLSTVNGLNSKWRTYSTRLLDDTGYLSSNTPGDGDTRVSVQPDLGGLSPARWMSLIDDFGNTPSYKRVNRLMLNLDPASLYASDGDPHISDADWSAYEVAILKDRTTLTADDEALIARLQRKIDRDRFTVSQRDDLLLAFLVALETGPGGVCSQSPLIDHRTPFFLHQRKYVHKQPSADFDAPSEADDEDQFADEMSNFINRVRDHDDKNGTHLLSWIAGVRLGENMSPDPQQWKGSVLYIARRINAETNGFLRERELIANGPIMGSDYQVTDSGKTIGIADDLKGDTFIPDISTETHSFGVGYKFMADGGKMVAKMEATSCPGGAPCDSDSVADWKYFLESKGFGELKKLVNHFYPSYPRHSNVVWVGDSGDAMATLVSGGAPTAGYEAISDEFVHAPDPATNPNFRGILFMESNTSEIDFEDPTKSHDIGKYMTYMNGGGTWPTLKVLPAPAGLHLSASLPLDWVPSADHSNEWETATISMWKSWPDLP